MPHASRPPALLLPLAVPPALAAFVRPLARPSSGVSPSPGGIPFPRWIPFIKWHPLPQVRPLPRVPSPSPGAVPFLGCHPLPQVVLADTRMGCVFLLTISHTVCFCLSSSDAPVTTACWGFSCQRVHCRRQGPVCLGQLASAGVATGVLAWPIVPRPVWGPRRGCPEAALVNSGER